MAVAGSLRVLFLLLLASLVQICRTLSDIESEDGTSVVPERFLPPRHFNHHPYTDVPVGRYSRFDRQERERTNRLRGGYKRNSLYNTGPILFDPKPTQYALPRSYKMKNDEHVPKKYMFHYVVHDAGGSGDDFSHAQTHDSGATTGEYRVRLPDGRLQVVKYTADSSGYKAKVMYHDDEEGLALNQHEAHPAPKAHHQLLAVSPYPPPQIDNNQVYHTPEREAYIQTGNDQYTYPDHQQQSITTGGHPAYVYLYQDGRITPILI